MALPADLTTAARASSLEEAVTEAFVALRDPLYHYLLSIIGRPDEAEELAQETFIRLFTELRRGHAIDDARPWAFRVAHNLAVDYLRGREPSGLAVTEDCAGAVADPAPSAEAVVLAAERRRRVGAALCRLTAQERQCLHLRSSGLRYREIAEVLSLRIPTVQTLLTRAIRKIEGATS